MEEARGRAGDFAALRADYDFEDEAVVIYGHFAYRAEDRELMELFKELARSESGHRNGLRRVIRSLQETATPVVLFCPLCGWELDFGPRPLRGRGGQVPHVPGPVRAAAGRGRRLDAREAGALTGARKTGDAGARKTGGREPGHPLPPEARAANLELWNHWTRIHEKSDFYDVEGFKAGASSLWPLEREELGPFIHEGTTLLHLQCHFGLDTLSWARLGARVVGLDFSDEAIALARRLADEVGLSGRAEFVCADLYDADAHLGDRRFDVVFVSWGAIEWLPDLDRWAGIVARHLEAGRHLLHGRDPPVRHGPRRGARRAGRAGAATAYSRRRTSRTSTRSRAATPTPAADTTGLVAYGWNHNFAELLGALTGAGLRLEHLHEFPTSPAPFWDWMVRDDDRWWWLPDGKGGLRKDLPLQLLAAREQAGGRSRPGPRGGLTMLDDYLKANLASWDEAVGLHVDSELYDVAGFKAGRPRSARSSWTSSGPSSATARPCCTCSATSASTR